MKRTDKALRKLYRDAMYYHLIRQRYPVVRAKIKVRLLFH
jgi:hypothetical protein